MTGGFSAAPASAAVATAAAATAAALSKIHAAAAIHSNRSLSVLFAQYSRARLLFGKINTRENAFGIWRLLLLLLLGNLEISAIIRAFSSGRHQQLHNRQHRQAAAEGESKLKEAESRASVH